jgi:hypothetical protein
VGSPANITTNEDDDDAEEELNFCGSRIITSLHLFSSRFLFLSFFTTTTKTTTTQRE